MKQHNGWGEKAVTQGELCEGHNYHTQRWKTIGNNTYKDSTSTKERSKERFTSLVHLLNVETLTECHHELSGNKASGIDNVTKVQYEENLSMIPVQKPQDN